MQQLITGLLFDVQIPLNMFRASLCPSSGAYQLQQQPLVYRRNVVVAVLLFVVGPAGGWVGLIAGLGVLDKRKAACPCQESNPEPSIPQPGQYDYTTPAPTFSKQ
jgi:hypothetical protein